MHQPDGTGPLSPMDTIPEEPVEDVEVESIDDEPRPDTTVRSPMRREPTLPAILSSIDLTEETELAPDAGMSFTQRTVLEAVGPLQDEFDWGDRLEDLQQRLERATTSERVALLLEIGEINWNKLDSRPEASRAFEEVLALDPGNTRAFNGLDAIYYLEWETQKLAELLIDRAANVEAPEEQALLLARVAELYEHLNQPDKAIIALEAAHRANRDDVQIAAHLAELTQPPEPTQPQDQLELLAAQLELLEHEAERIEILERMAGLHQQRGQLSQMVACLDQVLALDPRRNACYRRLEQHFQQQGSFERLVKTLERHVAVAPVEDRLAILHRMAKLYERPMGDLSRARAAYEAMLGLDPGHNVALAAMARLSEELQDFHTTVRALEALVQHEGNLEARVELHCRLATIQLEQLGDEDAGETQLARALELAPTHARCLSQLTEIYRGRGDWGKVVRLLLLAEAASATTVERARLLHAAGVATLDGLGDEDRALDLLQRTLDVNPDHLQAAATLSEIYWRRGRHEENLPVLELVLRKLLQQKAEASMLALVHYRLGVMAEALGQLDRAGQHLARAVKLSPDHLGAQLHLARVAVSQRRFDTAHELQRRLLQRREELQRDDLVQTLYEAGVCLRELGQREAAIEHLQQVLALDPSHATVVETLTQLQQDSSNWDEVVRLKQAQIGAASAEQQARLWREVGEIQWRKLGRPEQALGPLQRAVQLCPEDHEVLHDLIDLCSELQRWDSVVQYCGRMADLESRPALRARYHFTIGVVYRDRLDDADRALEYFNRVLDEDPTQLAAFEAIDKLCTKRRAWKQLELYYSRMIRRLPQEGHVPLKVMLWHNLGEVLRSRRRDFETAAAAFEVAVRLDPDNLDRQRILAELYSSLGPDYRARAVSVHHTLLRREPGRLEHYHRLRQLYMDATRYDEAWSLCMVLSFLRQADREEEGFYQQYRGSRLRQMTATLSDELWRHLYHPEQNVYISAILAHVTPMLATTTARPLAHYGLKPKELRDPGRADLPCLQVFDLVTAALVVTRPDLYLRPDQPEALLMAHTQNVPSFVAGAGVLQSTSEPQLAFIIGQQLSYLRPEHFLRNALPTRGQLQAVLLAVLRLCRPDFPVPKGHENAIEPIAERIQRQLQPASREQLGAVVHHLVSGNPSHNELNISRWWGGLDLTSDRVGFLLAGDLNLAAEMISADPGGSELSPKDRIHHLVQFACSEDYLALRKRLGLNIGA